VNQHYLETFRQVFNDFLSDKQYSSLIYADGDLTDLGNEKKKKIFLLKIYYLGDSFSNYYVHFILDLIEKEKLILKESVASSN
jgi:hypothetical protein